MSSTRVRHVAALLGLIGGVAVLSSRSGTLSGQTSSCGMQLNQTPAIFCETFDTPSPVTNRSGQLNGTLWGVSRLNGGGTGISQWKDSTLDGCSGPQAASINGATDVIIC